MIYTRETVLLNETKESHQIVFLQNVYRSVSEAESLIVFIYLVLSFHFRRKHVNRQISAFCADFRFRRKSNVNNDKKSELTETIIILMKYYISVYFGTYRIIKVFFIRLIKLILTYES